MVLAATLTRWMRPPSWFPDATTHASPGTMARSSGPMRLQMNRMSPTGSHPAASWPATAQAPESSTDTQRAIEVRALTYFSQPVAAMIPQPGSAQSAHRMVAGGAMMSVHIARS